ncbi:hypothetical protein FQN54_006588 [Arachnomyces sp. PD_36]|nr:hypothetical protein FQN54_006588 [Arachnomyces sp. PD_36]
MSLNNMVVDLRDLVELCQISLETDGPEKKRKLEELQVNAEVRDFDRMRASIEKVFDEFGEERGKSVSLTDTVDGVRRKWDDVREKLGSKKVSSASEARFREAQRTLEIRRILYRNELATGEWADINTSARTIEFGGDATYIIDGSHRYGCIERDTKTIKDAEKWEIPQAREYKEDFARAYGMSFDDASVNIQSCPRQSIPIFNARAELRDIPHWKEPEWQAIREPMERLINQLTETVVNTDAAERRKLFKTERSFPEVYERAHQLYRSFIFGFMMVRKEVLSLESLRRVLKGKQDGVEEVMKAREAGASE